MSAILRNLVTNKIDGIIGLIYDSINRIFLINYLDFKVVSTLEVSKDTKQRASFSTRLDRIVIGSWAGKMTCRSIQTGKILWASEINGFTYLNILEETGLLIVSGRDGDSYILNLRDGSLARSMEERSIIISQSYVLAANNVRELSLYDQRLNLLSSSSLDSWTIDVFDCDDDGNVIVSGPEIVGRFKIGERVKSKVFKDEFESLRDIAWHVRSGYFFGVARFFRGVPGISLIKFNNDLSICELIMKLDGVGFCRFVNNSKHLVCDTGFVFDLDEQKIISTSIDWKAIIDLEQ